MPAYTSITLRLGALLTAVLAAACTTPAEQAPTAGAPAPASTSSPAPAPAPAPTAPRPSASAPAAPPVATSTASPGAAALREGVSAFGQGDYKRAESRLNESQKLGLNQNDEKLQAFKTQAFLYCVTRRAALCEKSFDSAFATDRSFDLTRAERGHPVWGPVFAKVKKKQPK